MKLDSHAAETQRYVCANLPEYSAPLVLCCVKFVLMMKSKHAVVSIFQQRSQVFTALSRADEEYELLRSKSELQKLLMELILHGCIADLKESGWYSQR